MHKQVWELVTMTETEYKFKLMKISKRKKIRHKPGVPTSFRQEISKKSQNFKKSEKTRESLFLSFYTEFLLHFRGFFRRPGKNIFQNQISFHRDEKKWIFLP